MSSPPIPTLGSDRDSLPPKKQDQRLDSPKQSRDATFKVPFPCRSNNGLKSSHTGPPLQPIPTRVLPLYQPWTQSHTPTRTKPHVPTPFREYRGWTEWKELYPQGWDTLCPVWKLTHHQSPFSRRSREVCLPGFHFDQLHHPSKLRSMTLAAEDILGVGVGHRWESSASREQLSLQAERQSNSRHSRGPYMKRRDRQVGHSHMGITSSPASLSAEPASATEDQTPQPEFMHKHRRFDKSRLLGQSPLLLSSLRSSPVDFSTHKYTSTGVKEITAGSPSLSSSHRSPVASSSSDPLPWLLPHFAAGSLIELRDGRLRRVDDLQMEDFLLSSLACPELHLSYCTMQRISPSFTSSSSSSSLSRLLILLHDQHSQELVDVYTEFPFFVRGRGWSSCCPQRTARLCGLQCRQLSVGDICLVLTPLPPHSTPHPPPLPPSTNLRADTSTRGAEGGCGTLRPPCPKTALPTQLPPATESQKKEVEPARRRHWSAPEFRGPRINSPY